MKRTIGFAAFLLLLLLVAAPSVNAEPVHKSSVSQPAILTFTLNGPHPVPVAGSWIFLGCWQSRAGTPCLDVYQDPQGGLWICKACGTTGKPTQGKCRATTQAELDRGLWCS